MTAISNTAGPSLTAQNPFRPLASDLQPWLAAIAIVPILATVYQTLVLTDLADEVIRLGINGDRYSMIWTNACWGITVIYGVFIGIWAMPRYGSRDTLLAGLVWFALGNLLCGAATDVTSMAVAKLVEGIGKGMVIVLCRSMLYRQFDRMVIVSIGIYGVIAYATRPTTPLFTAWINEAISWRWVFWVNVPLSLLALPLVLRFVKPDRPAQPMPLQIDWIGVTLLNAWCINLLFLSGWYRKWGGWSSNAFAATAVLGLVLPIAMVARVGSGLTVTEHVRRLTRVRMYVLAMCVRMLLLLQLLAALTLMARYCTSVRGYPRVVSGWILAPASVTMAISTLLTTWFHRRSLRHFWLLVAVVGCAFCLWWMSSVDNFTSKQQLKWMMGSWGLFVGLIPPVFLQDEVEGLDRRDFLYGGAVAVVFLILPLVVVPTMTNTVISVWTDRAVDAQRLNLRQNRPEVEEATERVTDYYRQHGMDAPEASQAASTVLANFVKAESMARGIQAGFRFLSMTVGGLGLLATALLVYCRPSRSA